MHLHTSIHKYVCVHALFTYLPALRQAEGYEQKDTSTIIQKKDKLRTFPLDQAKQKKDFKDAGAPSTGLGHSLEAERPEFIHCSVVICGSPFTLMLLIFSPLNAYLSWQSALTSAGKKAC